MARCFGRCGANGLRTAGVLATALSGSWHSCSKKLGCPAPRWRGLLRANSYSVKISGTIRHNQRSARSGAVIEQNPGVLKLPPGTISGAMEKLTELLGHDGALVGPLADKWAFFEENKEVLLMLTSHFLA